MNEQNQTTRQDPLINLLFDDGKRMILGVSCALSEEEVHWRSLLIGLKERGIGLPDLITSDAHSGLKAALNASLNTCENVSGQIKKRTRVVGLFPSEESLLRLVTGVLIEICEAWETGKAYITLS